MTLRTESVGGSRILIYSLNYAPERFGVGKYSAEMAEWLVNEGNQVRVITAPPYYPEWRVARPYRMWRYHREQLHGVDVWRCPIWVPSRPTGATRILHLLSFSTFSLWPLARSLCWKPDCVLVVLPSLANAPAALTFSAIARCRSWLHVQDFELEIATKLKLARVNWIVGFLKLLEGWIYRSFDRVSTISVKMLEHVTEKGVPPDRCLLVRNWVAARRPVASASVAALRSQLSLESHQRVALFAGTINVKQNLEIVLRAARILENRPDLRFVICGTGPELEKIKGLAGQAPNISWLAPLADDAFEALLELADIHLLPQHESAADYVLPSKLNGMLASGRPVIATASAGTEIEEIVAGRGIVVPPCDARALANAIIKLIENPFDRRRLGAAARKYAEEKLSKKAVLSRFHDDLLHLIHRPPS